MWTRGGGVAAHIWRHAMISASIGLMILGMLIVLFALPASAPRDDGVPLCTRCLTPAPPLEHYCRRCGNAVGRFTPYIPYVRIPYYCDFFAQLWNQTWFERDGRVLRRVGYLAAIAWLAPCMLLGLPWVTSARRRAYRQQHGLCLDCGFGRPELGDSLCPNCGASRRRHARCDDEPSGISEARSPGVWDGICVWAMKRVSRGILIGVWLFVLGFPCWIISMNVAAGPAGGGWFKSSAFYIGLLGAVVAWAGSLVTSISLIAGAVLFVRKRLSRTKPGHCACGYNLIGNVSGVCPECGQVVR